MADIKNSPSVVYIDVTGLLMGDQKRPKMDVKSAEVHGSVITTSLVGSFEERAMKVIP